MPTTEQSQNIAAALAQIRAAERGLDDVVASTADAEDLSVLAGVYSQLTSFAMSLIQAQTTSDDLLFDKVKINLNAQATSLQASRDLIQHAIDDVATAAKIIGYLAQAAALIAKL